MLAKVTMKTDMYNAALTGKSDLYILLLYNHHKMYKLNQGWLAAWLYPGIQPEMKNQENMQVIGTMISKK